MHRNICVQDNVVPVNTVLLERLAQNDCLFAVTRRKLFREAKQIYVQIKKVNLLGEISVGTFFIELVGLWQTDNFLCQPDV